MSDARYSITVRPARVGYVASVVKETMLGDPDDDPWWVTWEPEPTCWRLTEAWAIRQARRKKRQLEESDARHAAIRVVE